MSADAKYHLKCLNDLNNRYRTHQNKKAKIEEQNLIEGKLYQIVGYPSACLMIIWELILLNYALLCIIFTNVSVAQQFYLNFTFNLSCFESSQKVTLILIDLIDFCHFF